MLRACWLCFQTYREKNLLAFNYVSKNLQSYFQITRQASRLTDQHSRLYFFSSSLLKQNTSRNTTTLELIHIVCMQLIIWCIKISLHLSCEMSDTQSWICFAYGLSSYTFSTNDSNYFSFYIASPAIRSYCKWEKDSILIMRVVFYSNKLKNNVKKRKRIYVSRSTPILSDDLEKLMPFFKSNKSHKSQN